jgi:hypothetical protein
MARRERGAVLQVYGDGANDHPGARTHAGPADVGKVLPEVRVRRLQGRVDGADLAARKHFHAAPEFWAAALRPERASDVREELPGPRGLQGQVCAD